jgi:2-keto-3-deoxy-L-rhamnonate aldolase RhmA
MRKNKFRELLNAGKPTISTRVASSWPSVVEAIGETGMFDYVEFLAEYAPYDLHSLDNFCRAAELHDMSTMIKVDDANRRYVAQRAIGSGFQSVLFTDARSAEDVREGIRFIRPDTPESGGLYPVAPRRMGGVGYCNFPEYVQALKDTVVVFMIEKAPAVDALEEILSVEGIDMVQWGPADYSMSVGQTKTFFSPEVKEVERRVFETAIRMGVPPRAEVNTPDDAKYYLDMGVRHFSLGTDITILHGWLKSNGESLRKAVEG